MFNDKDGVGKSHLQQSLELVDLISKGMGFQNINLRDN
jgi:hypothetical protein